MLKMRVACFSGQTLLDERSRFTEKSLNKGKANDSRLFADAHSHLRRRCAESAFLSRIVARAVLGRLSEQRFVASALLVHVARCHAPPCRQSHA